ncbi:polynucleotide 5'-hydroxyl-kinase NOL9 [Medicago truncatula]|uniref:polynucleotide 5'-hydroxyl-kinase NOL9 n=1 Tax=Medicago truncatula TaxID=3880 RepID=UPI00196893BE|nr:polynucleotide 5'-hydroxyl-kinase NOL9 [Medicago truncatula]
MGSSSAFVLPDIYIPQKWSQAANSITSSPTPPITLVCGASNCGKSTFSRNLLNVLLTRCNKVAYLETDVGQPEFTPPGFVSLTIVNKVTPDLTIPCLKTPERSLFFGDVSSQKDPSTYLKYICSIYDYYRKEYCTFDKRQNSSKIHLPLVVNTSGWVKGDGYKVLVNMLKYIGPTHIVKIGISTDLKNIPVGKFGSNGKNDRRVKLIEIYPARQDSSVPAQKDARLVRDSRIIAYFRQCFPSDSDISTIKDLANSLTSHCPYNVLIASIKIRRVLHEVPISEILSSLNASIVGLAVESEGPKKLPWCLGLGLVRGIDTVKGMLYLITPVPFGSLKKVNLLLQGNIQIPTSLLQVRNCFMYFLFLLNINL